jgi:predicted NAD/FAD-binding protein
MIWIWVRICLIQVVNKLSAHCDEVRLGCRIHSVRFDAASESVHVREESGRVSEFDEVVLATQAHQVLQTLM